MTKRLLSLLLAGIMLLSLFMTSCATTPEEGEEGEEVTQEEVQRQNLVLTLYAIKGDKMTDEALKAVEEKVSNYCVAKYKTAIDFRFFTEDEYENGLEDMYDKFAAEAAEKLKAEQEAAAAAKSEAEYKAKLSPEERVKYDQKKRQEAKKKAEEEKKKQEELAEQIEKGEDKATVKDTQMDIIYIPGMTEYYDYIAKGLLTDLNTFLTTTQKKITDYVYPAFMTAATVDGGVWGVPNNRDVAANETYFIVNQSIADKYGVDFTKIRSIAELEGAFARVAAGEPGMAPLYGDFGPEGLVFYEDYDLAHTTGVFADNLLGGTHIQPHTNAILNPNSTTSPAMNEYFALKAKYRTSGYMSDTNQNFFVSVQEISEAEKKEWEAKGYTAYLYKGANITTEAALSSGLFGISSHCRYPERAVEILQLMTCDSELHNLLTFGIEEEHYIHTAGDNENVITVIDPSYDMDFYKTGNALIGFVPDTMDADYVEKAKAKNLNAFINPFLGFRFDFTNESNSKWNGAYTEWKAYLDPIFAQLSYGVANWQELQNTAYQNVRYDANDMFTFDYGQWQNDCTFRSSFATHVEKIIKLRESLGITDTTEPAE